MNPSFILQIWLYQEEEDGRKSWIEVFGKGLCFLLLALQSSDLSFSLEQKGSLQIFEALEKKVKEEEGKWDDTTTTITTAAAAAVVTMIMIMIMVMIIIGNH